MSRDTHTIHPEIVKSVLDYEILVLGLPEKDLEDLLTNFVVERGKISKSSYEDFLIANCVANLNQFMAHINAVTSTGNINLLTVRQELTDLILKHNPLFAPENIVINKNQVLKLKSNLVSLDEVEHTLLTENIYWNKSYYDAKGNYKPVEPKEETKSQKPSKEAPNSEKKDIGELEWAPVQVWWSRINEYITIKKFSNEDKELILKQKYFHSNSSFNTYIVANCIVDVEDIYSLIDGMGANIDPNKLIRELFSLCESVNEGLTFARSKELQEPSDEEEDTPRPAGTQRAYAKNYEDPKKKKKKLTFKDVVKSDLLGLADTMKVSLVGQNEAVDTLVEAIKRASVGLKDPSRPIGSFLLAGRTGCGKTLTSKVLANELIRTKKNRVVIDCSEYSSDHEYAKLIGAPPGYLGHDDGGVLTNAVNENPFSVVVFDEIEKASVKVYDLLLQILDEGRLTDGKGRSVAFKDTIIILTSNIGVKEIDGVSKTIGFGDVAVLTEKRKSVALDEALKSKFKPEFLNRLDSIVYFKDLTRENYEKIIEIELDKLVENLKNNDTEYKNITLNFDKKIKEFIYNKGVDVKFGARPIKRAIEKHIATKIADLLLSNDFSPFVIINVTEKNDSVVLKAIDKEKDQEKKLLMHAKV